MAVYTVLDQQEIDAFIRPFGIGPLVDYEGVAAGIENSNYFVSTDQSGISSELHTAHTGHYVLTIFEAIAVADLRFYSELTTMLSARGLPVPCPLKDANGNSLHVLQGKPAVLVPRVIGKHPLQPEPSQCQAIGAALARTHLACLDWAQSHHGSRDYHWLKATAATLAPQLQATERELLAELPRFEQRTAQHPDLPQTVIHGDLFRDNALFDGNTLTGMIDFNSAGNGYLAMDLAVVVNDWCSLPDGRLSETLTNTTLTAYQQLRPLTADERLLWNDFLRLAALRFWVSRRFTQLNPAASHRPGGLVEFKDPQQFLDMLLQRIRHPHTVR